MPTPETLDQARLDEAAQAAQDLAAIGPDHEWFYPEELGKQIALSRATGESNVAMARREKAVNFINRLGVALDAGVINIPTEELSITTDCLKEAGIIEVGSESPAIQRDGHPQKRIFRLATEAVAPQP